MQKSLTANPVIWKIMKIGATQAMMAMLLFGIVLAHPNEAQILDKKVNVNIQQLPLGDALKAIEKASGVNIFYSSDHLSVNTSVSLTAENKTLKFVLDELLGPYDIGYSVFEKEKTIVLKRRNANNTGDRKSGTDQSDLREFKLSGVVLDATTGVKLPGVNIIIKGSVLGTTTDADGKYVLNVNDNDILVFTFIGYQTQEIPIGQRSVIDVMMAADMVTLDEAVVNAGYYKVDEKERTGNISRVSGEDISKQPVSNPLAALEGRMPGVQVTQTTGVPGGGFRVQIRGQNSLRTDGNNPLYVVDGVPFTSTSLTSPSVSGSIIEQGNPLSTINPSDIESIEVLKDADATAIYGSRGSNGVVLITTKRAKAGKTKFDLSVKTGLGTVASKMKLLNTPQYVTMRKEAFKNDGVDPDIYTAPDLLVWDTTRYTDWQKKLIGGTAHTTNAQASISGGDERTQFSVGTGYYRETTVFPGNFNFQRFSGAVNLNHVSPNGKFHALISINYSASINNLLSQDLTTVALTLPPDAPQLYDGSGAINSDWKNYSIQNPLFMTKAKYKNNTDNLVTNTVLSYDVLPGLTLKTNLGYTTMQVSELSTSPLASIPVQFRSASTGSSNLNSGTLKTWIMEPQASYNRRISHGNLNFLVGSTFQNSQQNGQTLFAYGFTSDALIENILAAPTVEVSGTSYYQYRYAAVFSRINFNWSEKYILNLTARRDGSSRFGNGRRFGNFGAIGAAWIFSNEGFLKDHADVLSFGKLRGSYGITGSDAIGNYLYLNSYTPTSYPYNGSSGLSLTRLNNPDYSWETNKKLEFALDLGFLKNKVMLSASVYNNRSSNQLVGLPLPALTGKSTVQFNFPATVQNRGIEISLNTTNINHSGFKWTSAFNFTAPTSKLVKFPNLASFPQYARTYQVGSSVFLKRKLKSTGVDPETGVYTFADANGDGNISTTADGFFSKSIAQQYYGGFNNSFSYKGIQLDIFFQYVKQTGDNYLTGFLWPGQESNQPAVVTNRWRQTGDVKSIQKYTAFNDADYSNQAGSDATIVDASFIRLKNVSLSYQFPSGWIQKARMTNARIYAQGQNLFTITHYQGLDPENRNISFLPPLRMITLGCQITF